jgi:hypothetical protein
MKAFRVSLLRMIGAVAVFAVAALAMAKPTPATAVATMTMTAGLILGSILASWIDKNMFCRGFAVFSLGLVLLNTINPLTISNQVLALALFPVLHASVIKSNPDPANPSLFTNVVNYGGTAGGQPPIPWNSTTAFQSFDAICSCLTCLTFGFSGGCLALLIIDRREERLADQAKKATA